MNVDKAAIMVVLDRSGSMVTHLEECLEVFVGTALAVVTAASKCW